MCFCFFFQLSQVLTSYIKERKGKERKKGPYAYVGFPSGSAVKTLPAIQETWVVSLKWDDPLEEGMETHSSTVA